MAVVLGIDAGATKTAAVVLDEQGQALGRGAGGPANYHSTGLESAVSALHHAGDQALASARMSWHDVVVFCLGSAGVDRPADIARLRPLIAGFAPRVQIVNDAVVALVGGLGHAGVGVVVIAGTGSIIYGQDGSGHSARAGGWGTVLGDEGSGFWIGSAALRAVARAADGRGEATALTGLVLDHLQIPDPDALIGVVYTPAFSVSYTARLAQTVLTAATGGDAVARRILAQAGQELALGILTVLRRLSLLDSNVEVVTCGGLIKQPTALRDALLQALVAAAPHARPMIPRHDAAMGAALLALDGLHHA